jgi:16S rRNA (guanine966-N2)-methyltransferase
VRIIAGRLGGRQFASPKNSRTHPMSDKMRGALFNTLGDIEGLTILDAFAGSGALGFEAISRGAQSVVAIEKDQAAQKTIEANIEQLEVGGLIQSIKITAGSWLSTTDTTFDIVVCDPPYDDIQPKLLEQLAQHAKVGGIIVLSLPPSAEVVLSPSVYHLLSQKSYGDSELVFYRKQS